MEELNQVISNCLYNLNIMNYDFDSLSSYHFFSLHAYISYCEIIFLKHYNVIFTSNIFSLTHAVIQVGILCIALKKRWHSRKKKERKKETELAFGFWVIKILISGGLGKTHILKIRLEIIKDRRTKRDTSCSGDSYDPLGGGEKEKLCPCGKRGAQ